MQVVDMGLKKVVNQEEKEGVDIRIVPRAGPNMDL